MNAVYSLESENLSSLGSMGSSSTTNFVRLFSTKEYAKEYAEKDYGDKIEWENDRSGGCCSGDLRYVMYNIKRVRLTK